MTSRQIVVPAMPPYPSLVIHAAQVGGEYDWRGGTFKIPIPYTRALCGTYCWPVHPKHGSIISCAKCIKHQGATP